MAEEAATFITPASLLKACMLVAVAFWCEAEILEFGGMSVKVVLRNLAEVCAANVELSIWLIVDKGVMVLSSAVALIVLFINE